MKVTISTHEFRNALRQVAPIIRRYSTIPEARHILLETGENTLSVTATALDLAIAITLPASVSEPGKVIVPDRILSKWLATLPYGDLLFYSYQSHLDFSQPGDFDTGRFSVPTLEGEFPSFSNIDKAEPVVTLEPEQAKDFRAMLLRAQPFASGDDARPALNGIMLDFRADGIFAEATDGFRVIATHTDIPCLEREFKALVPLTALNQILRLPLFSEPLEIKIIPFENGYYAMTMISGAIRLAFCLTTDTRFPDWRVLVPKQFGSTCQFNREHLLNVTRQAQVIIGLDRGPLLFQLQDKASTAHLSISHDENGSLNRELPVWYTGKELRLAFGPFLLYDAVKVISKEAVEIQICDAKTVVLMRDDITTVLLMPMLG